MDPLPRRQLALLVLLGDRLLGGGVDRLLAQLAQVGELLLVALGELLAHGAPILCPRRRSYASRGALEHRDQGRGHAGVELGSGRAAKRADGHPPALVRGGAARCRRRLRSGPSSQTQATRTIRDSIGICSPARPAGPLPSKRSPKAPIHVAGLIGNARAPSQLGAARKPRVEQHTVVAWSTRRQAWPGPPPARRRCRPRAVSPPRAPPPRGRAPGPARRRRRRRRSRSRRRGRGSRAGGAPVPRGAPSPAL